MRYFDKDKISKGKKFINISIIILFLLDLINLLIDISKKDINIKGDIIFSFVFFIIVVLYYKENNFIFKIITSIIPLLFIIPALMVFGFTTYVIPFSFLNLLGGGMLLILLLIYTGIMYYIFSKIGWFECIDEYRSYMNKND